jgi:predicted secreted protein
MRPAAKAAAAHVSGWGIRVLLRLLGALVVLNVAAARHVAAGDAATVAILGFSADGRTFAFEEFGVQDGSGFPYANRYYLNVSEDSFVPGTPIRVRIDDESATVDSARAQARERGESIVPQTELEANPGYTAALNPVTELSADKFRLAVNPRPVFPPVDTPMEFRLEEFPVEAPQACSGVDGIKGFRLLRIHPVEGGVTEVLHEDNSIPRSRGCPVGYALGGVQTFFPQHALTAFAVMISVRRHGFEGPDHRWLAVTRRW